MVTLRTYWNQAEAAIAKTLLEDHGIVCALADENSNLYAGTGQIAIPIRLMVEEGSAEQARHLLDEPQPALPDDFDPPDSAPTPKATGDPELVSELTRLRHANHWILLGLIVIGLLTVYLVSELPNRTSPWSEVSHAKWRYDYVTAIHLAKRLAAKSPSDYYAHQMLGEIYWEMGDMDNAEKEYLLAYQLSPPQVFQEKLDAIRRRRQHENNSKPSPTVIP